jgi:YD repeat-containing protein
MSASPAIVAAGDKVTITVTIKNNSDRGLIDLAFKDRLTTGLSFVDSDLASYDPGGKVVSYSIASLPNNASETFSYTLQVNNNNNSNPNSEVWLHTARLTTRDGKVNLAGQVAFEVQPEAQSEDASLAVVDPQGGWHDLGNVSVYLQPGTVEDNSILVAAPVTEPTKGPEEQVKLSVIQTAPIEHDQAGNPTDQHVAVQSDAGGELNNPAFIEFNLDKVTDLDNIPAGQEAYIATYYEDYNIWVKVPIQETDYAKNAVTVQATHFSTWGAGLGNKLPQNGTGALLFDQPYTSLFTGSAQYSVPIWTPAGRGGLSPNISLSYSSGNIDGILGDVQAPWVGEGWNIDGTEIVRRITTDGNGYGYENSFALTLNGAVYNLIRDDTHPNRYYVQQNGFLYIERHNRAMGNDQGVNNDSGEWWEIVTTNGTHYRLGWNTNSEQLAPMYGYSCTIGGPRCITPNGPYASVGYAGNDTDLVARRWRVDKVTDRLGNYMEYTYQEFQPSPNSQVLAYDRESYLKTISFTGFDFGTTHQDPSYQVKFITADRSSVGDVPNLYNVWDYFDSKYLDEIDICYHACDAYDHVVIRTYDLNYSLATAPNANGTLILDSIKISGGGFIENEISIPFTSSATVRFTYENLPNRASGNGDQFNYPRLTQIDNGYGGMLTYTYETDGRPNTSWYDYRVQKAQVESGLGLATVQTYAYQTPVYNGQGNDPNLGGLIGYTTTTATSVDFINNNAPILDTKHTFGTTGLDIGRELSTEMKDDAAGTVLAKMVNTYVTDNSQAPFFGWNYRYLYQTESYVSTAGNLALTTKITYQNDPGTGNLLVQTDYLGSSLYRKTCYEYMVNLDPSIYLLDNVSRRVIVDANNIVSLDVHYNYDYQIGTAPTRGELTLVQAMTGDGNQTVDSTTVYDTYGNVTRSRQYKDYGVLNTAPVESPSDKYIEQSTVYDDTNTYPISQTNTMNETTQTAYLYTLGVPYQVNDPNGWVTTTTYDGLGRTLSVTPPGLRQAGVTYTYPSPDGTGKVTPPYSIDMEILDEAAGFYRSVWGIYDGLGRIIQNQIFDADQQQNQLLLTDTAFDAQGKTYRQSQPYYSNGATGSYIAPTWSNLVYTESAYDALGRIKTVTAPGDLLTQTSYGGLTTTTTDPNGNAKNQTTDGLGRVAQVQEFSDGSLYSTTQYSYDIADRLTKTMDAQENVSTITYNQLGQKTGMHDPDMGDWAYQYDPLGRMIQQTDARGQSLSFTYDDLGRMLQKIDTASNAVLATYTYGAMAGVFGMRTSMTDGSGSTSWSYNDYGHTVIQSQTIGGITKAATTTTDWLGRALTTTNPEGETLTYHYDALGRPKDLSSSSYNTLASLAYNELGQITQTSLGQHITVSNTYDDNTSRLLTHSATNDSNNTLMNFSYTYDNDGNILTLTDTKLNEVHTYTYDALNRLLTALGFDQDTSTTVYQQDYGYDKLGNILQVNLTGSQAYIQGSFKASMDLKSLFPARGIPDISFDISNAPLYKQSTDTPTPTHTYTPTATATNTATYTPSVTPTWTNTYTPTFTFSPTNTPTSTYTATSTFTPTATSTSTNTPSPTITPTPEPVIQVLNSSYAVGMDLNLAWNHTVSTTGQNRILLVGVSNRWTNVGENHHLTVTYNNLPLYFLGRKTVTSGNTNLWVDLWYYMDPPPGTYQVQISTLYAYYPYITAGALTISGVDQENPFGTLANNSGSGNSSSLQVSSATDQLVVDVIGQWANMTNATVGAGQTKQWSSGSADNYDGGGMSTERATSGSVTMSWNMPVSQSWAALGISLIPTERPTATPTASLTPTPSSTRTPTPTRSNTPTLAPTSTATPTITGTLTPTLSPTWTRTIIATNIRVPTLTPSLTPSPSAPTSTSTRTLTPTLTYTSTPVLNSSLMGYWSFDSINGTSAPDDSGRNHPGTIAGNALSSPNSHSGSSVYFDGGDDAVSVAYHADFAPSQSFSVGAWINPLNIATGKYTRIIDRWGVFALYFNPNGYLQFQVEGLTPNNVIGPKLPLNQWNLIYAMYDYGNQQLRIYVNGELAAAASVTGTKAANTNALYFGSTTANERFNGWLDEVRFYNRVLTVDELNGLSSIATVTPRATSTPAISRVTIGGTPSDNGAANPANQDETKAFDNSTRRWCMNS